MIIYESEFLRYSDVGIPHAWLPSWKRTKEGGHHYLTYPAKLNRDLDPRISKPTASKILAKLESEGILAKEKNRPPRRKEETPHYYLRNDSQALRGIFSYTNDYKIDEIDFSEFKFFRKAMISDFILNTLNDHNAVMNRDIFFWDIGPEHSRDMFEFYAKWSFPRIVETDFEEHLMKCLNVIYGSSTDRSIEKCPSSIDFSFPIGELSSLDTNNLISILKKRFHGYDRIKEKTHSCYESILKEHYGLLQDRYLLQPILMMIRNSSRALDFFLGDKWVTPRCFSDQYLEIENSPSFYPYSYYGNREFQTLFYYLALGSINDHMLSDYKSEYYDSLFLDSETISPIVGDTGNIFFRIQEIEGNMIDFSLSPIQDAKKPNYYIEDFEIIKEKLDNLLCGNFNFIVKISGYFALQPLDIVNWSTFIEMIRNNSDGVLLILTQHLPNRFKNIIKYLGFGDYWNDKVKSDFINELNFILYKIPLWQYADPSLASEINHRVVESSIKFDEMHRETIMEMNRLVLESHLNGCIKPLEL